MLLLMINVETFFTNAVYYIVYDGIFVQNICKNRTFYCSIHETQLRANISDAKLSFSWNLNYISKPKKYFIHSFFLLIENDILRIFNPYDERIYSNEIISLMSLVFLSSAPFVLFGFFCFWFHPFTNAFRLKSFTLLRGIIHVCEKVQQRKTTFVQMIMIMTVIWIKLKGDFNVLNKYHGYYKCFSAILCFYFDFFFSFFILIYV